MPRWLLIAFCLLFLSLTIVAAGSNVLLGDEATLDAIQTLPNAPWQTVADIGNILGTTPASPIALTALALISYRKRHRWLVVFCAVLLTFRLLGMYAKGLFDSPRPYTPLAEIRDRFDGLGYPSGHALTSMIVAGACTLILPRIWPGSGWVRFAVSLLWIWTLACGFARVWYGAHWPSDVLGGYLLGVVMIGISAEIATVAVRFRPFTLHQRRKRRL